MLGIDLHALRVAWTTFLLALLFVVIYYIRDTLLLFAVAIFFAYMLGPIVNWIEKFMPRRRSLALAAVYIALIGALVGIGFAVVPAILSEASNLAQRLPSLLSTGGLAKFPLPAWLAPMRDQVLTVLNREAVNLARNVVPLIQKDALKILSGLGSIVLLILVPILAFFFLKDGRHIRDAILGAVEEGQNRSTLKSILDDIDRLLSQYIRALILLSLSAFVFWVLFLAAMRYPYALLMSGILAILEFIPVIGPAVGLAAILALYGIAGSGGLIWLVVFWGCFRVFQDYVVNPYLMSAGVELHPLLVLFGVLAGGSLAGIPGIFFSVPVIAILKVLYLHLRGSSERRQLTAA